MLADGYGVNIGQQKNWNFNWSFRAHLLHVRPGTSWAGDMKR